MDKKTNKKIVKTLDINTILFDNVAFVFFHVMETFSKDFSEVRGLRSRGFSFFLHELQHCCARNFEKKCKLNQLPEFHSVFHVPSHGTLISQYLQTYRTIFYLLDLEVPELSST